MSKDFVHLRESLKRWLNEAGIRSVLVAVAFSGVGVLQFASGGGDSQLSSLNELEPERGSESGSPNDPNRNRRRAIIIIIVSILLLACGGVFGFALYRARVISNPSTELTAMVAVGGQTSCQELIDRAMQASGDACDQVGSNEVCYGNNTLVAELVPGDLKQFRQRGDTINVEELQRLAASPLSLAGEEWGIAVFKIIANLPRSLPGETITMVVFGNTTLDNQSKNLETFYFSSTLGQIDCEKVPFDGLMITMPDGAGISFVINGAEMTLMGNASITATRNGEMEVTMYSGSAYIASNGQSQIVTAGQKTSMDLGGPDGTSAVSPPSPPQPLSPEELSVACTMTGDFCSMQEITPVSQQDALITLLALLGIATPSDTNDISLPDSMSTTTPSLLPVPNLASTKTPMSQSNPTATLLPTSTDTLPPPPSPTNSPQPPTATNPPPPTATNPPPPKATNPPPPKATNPPPHVYVTLCHYITGADKYSEITVAVDPVTGKTPHDNHPDDIIPAPSGGCPQPIP